MSRYINADNLFNWGKHKLSDAVKYGNKDGEQQDFSYGTLMMYEIAGEIDDAPGFETDIPLDRLRALVEADRDGRCVVLPCKVGTRVWVIGQNCDLCRDMYAEEPCLFGSCEYKEVFESVFGYGMIDNFGKTVFLTREAAEAALAGQEDA